MLFRVRSLATSVWSCSIADRGCRYCVEQLRAFQRASVRLAEAGIEVAALSVDDETTTAELIGKYGLTFAVGHSADAIALSAETGAFANLDPPYLQSTGFVLDPTGNVISASTPVEPLGSSYRMMFSNWSAIWMNSRQILG